MQINSGDDYEDGEVIGNARGVPLWIMVGPPPDSARGAHRPVTAMGTWKRFRHLPEYLEPRNRYYTENYVHSYMHR